MRDKGWRDKGATGDVACAGAPMGSFAVAPARAKRRAKAGHMTRRRDRELDDGTTVLPIVRPRARESARGRGRSPDARRAVRQATPAGGGPVARRGAQANTAAAGGRGGIQRKAGASWVGLCFRQREGKKLRKARTINFAKQGPAAELTCCFETSKHRNCRMQQWPWAMAALSGQLCSS